MESPTGVGILIADIGLQLALLAVGQVGPLSLDRLGAAGGYCLAAGVAFALTYVGLLLLDFAGHPLPLNPILLFVAVAIAVSAAVGYQSRRVIQGMFAAAWSLVLGTLLWSTLFLIIAYAFWGTRRAHGFWLRDGALADFHRSGGKDLSVFLLRDIEGALFFHPILSVALGLLCGAAGAAVGLAGATLRQRTASQVS